MCHMMAVWAHHSMLQHAAASFIPAVLHTHVELQVINLRSLKPLDRETIADSVRKTHHLVSVEEGWPQSGIGAEISALAMEEFFDELDAPVGRVTGAEVPTPYAANLEAMSFPQAEDVIRQVKQTLGKA